MPWFYYVTITMIKIVLVLFTNWQIRGKENVPAEGALVVVSNHVSMADPPILGASLGRLAWFMAKQGLFSSRFSNYVMRGFGAFPVRRQGVDRAVLRWADQILAQGLALGIFPEGTRSLDAKLRPPLMGTVRIALRNSVSIVPVGISGTVKLRGFAWWLRRPRIIVNIGKPFSLPSVDGRLTKAERAELADTIMIRIAELLPLEYRGYYAGQVNRDAAED